MLRLIEQIGSFAGLAAFIGLGVFALLSFTHGRDIRRLREWAGSAPERDAERKETTSAIAAQRAEELRQLEESRTAEHEVVTRREERRRRRDAGMMAIVGGVAYAALSGSGEGGGKRGKQAAAKTRPSEVEVTVLNGTAVPGLAASYGNKVQGKGFKLGAVTNSSSSFAESVVMYKRGHAPEARKVAKQLGISKLQLMNGEIEGVSAGANVAVIVGEDNAAAAG